jgi:acetyltransferase
MPPVDREALKEVLLCISEMVWNCQDSEHRPSTRDRRLRTARSPADARIVIDHTGNSNGDRYAHWRSIPTPSTSSRNGRWNDGQVVTIRRSARKTPDMEQDSCT